MRRHGTVALVLALAVITIAGLACSSQQRVKTETALARSLISDEQSRQIGEQVHAELESQGVRLVRDSTVVNYVEAIGDRIFALAKKDRAGIDYHVHVIDNPKTVNAFATPGGHIYVYSGLLVEADNEAEVAGVMAHEAGHVAGRHVERAIVNAYGLQALASAALGKNPSTVGQLAAGIVGTGIMSAHSRSEETEADEYGARYVSQIGYDPRAMITFFGKLQAREGKTSGAFGWLRTHPVTQDRIDHLQRYIRENKLTGTQLGEDRHRSVKQRL